MTDLLKLSSITLILTLALGCSQQSEKKKPVTTEKPTELTADFNISAAKNLYQTCAACHGHNAEGMKALNAPAIANQESWYLKQQLNNFRKGRRGKHPDDMYGATMLSMANVLKNEEDVELVTTYIGMLPHVKTEKTLEGNVENGKNYYNMICGSCHGPGAVGNALLHSPALLGMNDWYLVRQLENFRAGIRGTSMDDLHGVQMRDIAETIPDDASILDVVAYIQSLQ